MKHHQAKKSLGQNFLNSKKVIFDIVKGAQLTKNDTVLEIGPGKGALTDQLCKNAGQIIAVEKDRELIEFLTEKFKEEIAAGTLVLIEGDIISFDPKKYGLVSHGYKIVANIPYYITGEILEKFLSNEIQPERMVLLIQKEVAVRIAAKNKKESILSLSVKVFGTPVILRMVPASFFSPRPKVDSAVLLIKDISRKYFTQQEERLFFTLIKAAFRHKRKQIMNNIGKLCSKKQLEKIFEKQNHPPAIRAEDLSMGDWIEITKAFCPSLLTTREK